MVTNPPPYTSNADFSTIDLEKLPPAPLPPLTPNDHADPNHPHYPRASTTQPNAPGKNWTRKRIAYAAVLTSVFLALLAAAFILGFKLVGPKFARNASQQAPMNATQWHTVTSTVTPSATPSLTPEDNSGGPAGGDGEPGESCRLVLSYGDEKACDKWCVVPSGREKACVEDREARVWK